MRLPRRPRRDRRAEDGRRYVKEILADTRAQYGKPLDCDGGRRLLDQSGEVVVSALFATLEAAEPDGNSFGMATLAARDLASQLARRKLPFTADDVEALVRRASSGSEWLEAERLRIAVAAAETHAREHGIEAIRKPLREIFSWAERDHATVYRSERTKLRARVRKLLETAPPEEIDLSLIGADDWGRRARRVLERRRRDPAVAALIAHLAGATQASPSQRWRAKAVELVAQAGAGPLLRELLEEALSAKDGRRQYWGEHYVYQYVSDESATLLRGIVSAAAATEEPWATEVVGRLAVHTVAPFRPGYEQRSMKVVNACIRALGELGGDEAVARLTALRTTVKHKSLLTQVESALEQAAAAIGITKSQLLERQVPAFDLDADGRREVQLGDVTAVVGTAGLEWRDADGRVLKSAPARVREEHADELAALRADAKEIKQRLAVERARIEALLAEERRWPLEEWRRFYRDHPLVGTVARPLLWRFSRAGRTEVALGADAPRARRRSSSGIRSTRHPTTCSGGGGRSSSDESNSRSSRPTARSTSSLQRSARPGPTRTASRRTSCGTGRPTP